MERLQAADHTIKEEYAKQEALKAKEEKAALEQMLHKNAGFPV